MAVSYVKFIRCTQDQYNALITKDQDTLYFVYHPNTAEKGKLYLGNRSILGSSITDENISISDIPEIIINENISDGDVLIYNEFTEKWENKSIYTVLNIPIMTGATEHDDGIAGLVPVPKSGDQLKFLNGAGKWVNVIGTISDEDIEAFKDLKATVATVIGDDYGKSIRDISNETVEIVKEKVNNLDDLLNGDFGLVKRVQNLEDTIGDFHPVETKYLNIGGAIDYFDSSITALNDQLRWHSMEE